MRQQKHPVQLAALLFFIHLTSVLSSPIPQTNNPTNCASCHAFNQFQSTQDNEELYDNTGISRRQPRLASVDQEPNRNVAGTWFRRWVSQLAAGSNDKRNIDDGRARIQARGWSSQDGDSTTETANAGHDFRSKPLKKRTDAPGGSVAEDLEAHDGLASKSVEERTDPAGWSFDEHKGDGAAETSGTHFYRSGSWQRRWKGQNIAGANADPAGADSGVGNTEQKRGLITADVAPTEDEQSGVQQGTCVTCTKRTVPDWDNVLPTEDTKGGACADCVTKPSRLAWTQTTSQIQDEQAKLKRGFITVDVAPADGGTVDVQQGDCPSCLKKRSVAD
ncbi:hypothetical protein EPUS_05560 [Endocarpon pusillum Z07020]|uniref:Cytochrome c domain-containing protein n=1 Tax=Endocarpon pusillum (strain Z07020 / HMAS-L-300199) TaxID=1263415 RepID=U1HTE6_ENDPU|nr:uncharacterized protein EPUS_05560 [Endocarpon pusillum Z07020]ERF73855.1 hypothetical protein EPUS_05560 [Endocarpon pusillum Z07020]